MNILKTKHRDGFLPVNHQKKSHLKMSSEEFTQADYSTGRINLVTCKSILSRSRIPGLDYCINPYTGCLHGCVYCYARFMNRFSSQRREWGEFVDVKTNAVEMLKKQLTRLREVNISLSTVTDPYQTIERSHKITRQLLAELAASGSRVSILTKSDLVERDIDILKRFSSGKIEVGFSIFTLDEDIKRNFEKRSPAVEARIRALKKIHREGIGTWVFIAPILPFLTERSLPALLEEIKPAVDYIMLDSLNIKSGNWPEISKVLKEKYPSLSSQWQAVCFSRAERNRYYSQFRDRVTKLSKMHHIDLRFC